MLQNIQKCNIFKVQRVTGNVKSYVTLQEQGKFVGLMITRSVLEQKILPSSSLQNTF